MDTSEWAPHPHHREYIITVSLDSRGWSYFVTCPRGEQITCAGGFSTRAEARYVAERDVCYVLETPGLSFEGARS